MVFKLTFRDRMIISFFLKFPCLECSWIHLKPFTFFKFHVSKLYSVLMKHWHWQHIEMSESYAEAKTVLDNAKSSAWRFFKFLVFWNNRQLIGSCLYSLVLARGLFLRRLSPLVYSRYPESFRFLGRWSEGGMAKDHTSPPFFFWNPSLSNHISWI